MNLHSSKSSHNPSNLNNQTYRIMRQTKRILTMITAVLCLFMHPIIGYAQEKTNGNSKNAEKKGHSKILIVFFSHTGENYAVGNIEVGNTKMVADYIRDVTGGDEFEVVRETPYPKTYKEVVEVAKKERYGNEYPPFKGKVNNIDDYDVVFLGGPVWIHSYPQVMFTFMKQYDLSKKTLIPFLTHEGSGLGYAVQDIKKIYPDANILSPEAFYGHEVRTDMSKVKAWLETLGYKK